jgi:hypothetical protein
VCLATAVVVQVASATLLFAERAIADERAGRQRLEEKNDILAQLATRAATSWQPADWTVTGAGEGLVERITATEEWLLAARARQDATLSLGETCAWMERGRDGLDLPVAALVAHTVTAGPGRESSVWIDGDDRAAAGGEVVGSGAECYLRSVPAELAVGPAVTVHGLGVPWRLGAGWEGMVRGLAGGDAGAVPAGAPLAGEAGVVMLSAEAGRTVVLRPSDAAVAGAGASPERPLLVVLVGGGSLDMREWGDAFAVVVVDDGALLLDGTTVHGAVFATKTVALGSSGRILFAKDVLRWATDRSLTRVRLVPGTRREGME